MKAFLETTFDPYDLEILHIMLNEGIEARA